jgi:hypothetical protein
VTGTWSGLIRDQGCGEGTLTIEIQQFQTQFGHFFYGKYARSFPGRGEPCTDDGSLVEGILEADFVDKGEVWFTLSPANQLDCMWQARGQRDGVSSFSLIHTRPCSTSAGIIILSRQ